MSNIKIYKEDIEKVYLSSLIEKDNPIILDVGCYDGSDSKGFLEVFKKPQIYAFEPDSRSREMFLENTTAEERKDIRLQPIALTNTDGKIKWFASNSNTRRHHPHQKSWSASSSSSPPKDCLEIFDDLTFDSSGDVKSARLDTWIAEYKNIDIVDIIWADVNGSEREFLLGSAETLKRTRFLYIEFCKTDTVQLYENAISRKAISDLLPDFKEIAIYSFLGNYGNILLKNTHL
jgi:FkbM family methyltransferase